MGARQGRLLDAVLQFLIDTENTGMRAPGLARQGRPTDGGRCRTAVYDNGRSG
jgi:hypothetical protein